MNDIDVIFEITVATQLHPLQTEFLVTQIKLIEMAFSPSVLRSPHTTEK